MTQNNELYTKIKAIAKEMEASDKKINILFELSKAAKTHGKAFVYTATNSSLYLKDFKCANEITEIECKRLFITDLVQELADSLQNQKEIADYLLARIKELLEAETPCEHQLDGYKVVNITRKCIKCQGWVTEKLPITPVKTPPKDKLVEMINAEVIKCGAGDSQNRIANEAYAVIEPYLRGK